MLSRSNENENKNWRIEHDPENTYFIIDGMVAADARLSLEAKGLYFLLLTIEHSPNRPKLHGLGIIWNEKNIALVQELIDVGYYEKVRAENE
jgi:hypothetical protein